MLAHLPFAPAQTFRVPAFTDEEARRQGRGGWVVLRMDERGHRFDLVSLSHERSARCMAELMQTRGHKQAYFTELRGEAPQLPMAEPGPARWVLLRQDEHGVRHEVRRSPHRSQLLFLAERFNQEPRHKQLWLVEPLNDAPSHG